MHYAISATWGPTDTTRAALPFIFAASALQAGDSVMLMLFHDAVHIAVKEVHQKIVPFGPAPKFEEVFSHPGARIVVCKPCADARGIREDMLLDNCSLGGMDDFHKETALPDSRIVAF